MPIACRRSGRTACHAQSAALLQARFPEHKLAVRNLGFSGDELTFRLRSADFRTPDQWLTRTKAGIALGYAALLGLLVGLLITAQTLYAATMASAKEFATLLALGIPRRKIYGLVIVEAFWVGVIGVLLACPVVLGLAELASMAGAKVVVRWEILLGAALITLATALLAGVFALRSVRRIEPMSLLR